MPSAIGNFFMKMIIESPLHPILGGSFGVITVQGRKTGKAYATPINVAREGDGFTVVSLRTRTWWRNLRGGQPAQLHIAGSTHTVRGEVLEDPGAVAAELGKFFQARPGQARYYGIQLATDGSLPAEDLARVAGERVIIKLRSTAAP